MKRTPRPRPDTRRNTRPIDEADIELGTPLPSPVFDRTGKLLLGEGAVVSCSAQRDALLQRGVLAQKGQSLLRPNEAAPAAPSMIEALQALQQELGFLHRKLLARDAEGVARRLAAIVAELRAHAARDPDAALASMQLRLEPDDHAARQLHAAIVCVLAARTMDLSPVAGDALIAAALTHDLALGPLSARLNGQSGDLTPEQRCQVQAHPEEGAELLLAAGVTDPLWLDAVLHHHERLDGSGYPHGLRGDEISATTRMLAIADIYTAMVRPRAYREAVHAREALRTIFLERGKLVDEALAAMLVKEVGVFPPGTLVRLANLEVGVVLRRGDDAARPLVARVVTREGTRANVPVTRDTRQPDLAIVETVSPERYPGLMSNIACLWSA